MVMSSDVTASGASNVEELLYRVSEICEGL